MKRIWMLLAVLALGVALAAPASAKKPDCTGNSCNTDTDGIGMTCAEAEAIGFEHVAPTWFPSGEPVQVLDPPDSWFELGLRRGSACVDVTSEAGQWTVEVLEVGSAREVYVAVRDSVNPGDTCWGVSDIGPITEPSAFSPILPMSIVDACGTGEADEDPQLTFNVWYPGKLRQPVKVRVTLP